MKSMDKNIIRDLYRGINEFKRGYKPRSNLVKDENGNDHADSHRILNRWKDCFSQNILLVAYCWEARKKETNRNT
jgi:hypothetical protein